MQSTALYFNSSVLCDIALYDLLLLPYFHLNFPSIPVHLILFCNLGTAHLLRHLYCQRSLFFDVLLLVIIRWGWSAHANSGGVHAAVLWVTCIHSVLHNCHTGPSLIRTHCKQHYYYLSVPPPFSLFFLGPLTNYSCEETECLCIRLTLPFCVVIFFFLLQLPITAASFFEPLPTDKAAFMTRWKALEGEKGEIQEIISGTNKSYQSPAYGRLPRLWQHPAFDLSFDSSCRAIPCHVLSSLTLPDPALPYPISCPTLF